MWPRSSRVYPTKTSTRQEETPPNQRMLSTFLVCGSPSAAPPVSEEVLYLLPAHPPPIHPHFRPFACRSSRRRETRFSASSPTSSSCERPQPESSEKLTRSDQKSVRNDCWTDLLLCFCGCDLSSWEARNKRFRAGYIYICIRRLDGASRPSIASARPSFGRH